MSGVEKLPVIVELERVFNLLNKQMFGGRLAIPTLTIQLEKKVVFRFVPESYYMLIGSKFIDCSSQEILEQLLHEMVHISNHADGVVDCTSNQYHNKRFLSAALEAGFYVFRHKTQGWGETHFFVDDDVIGVNTPKPDDLRRRERVFASLKLDKEVIEYAQTRMAKRLEETSARKVCFLKYICECPQPHNSIRSGRRPDGDHPISIRCNICKSNFVLAEGQESD